jgi:hypothetical protein
MVVKTRGPLSPLIGLACKSSFFGFPPPGPASGSQRSPCRHSRPRPPRLPVSIRFHTLIHIFHLPPGGRKFTFILPGRFLRPASPHFCRTFSGTRQSRFDVLFTLSACPPRQSPVSRRFSPKLAPPDEYPPPPRGSQILRPFYPAGPSDPQVFGSAALSPDLRLPLAGPNFTPFLPVGSPAA